MMRGRIAENRDDENLHEPIVSNIESSEEVSYVGIRNRGCLLNGSGNIFVVGFIGLYWHWAPEEYPSECKVQAVRPASMDNTHG
jgi:hypothetical protein